MSESDPLDADSTRYFPLTTVPDRSSLSQRLQSQELGQHSWVRTATLGTIAHLFSASHHSGREGEREESTRPPERGRAGENRGIESAYSVLDHLFYYMIHITTKQGKCQVFLERKFSSPPSGCMC